ncbi:acyl carrier protein [Streptomyces radicis]|uniref:Acyl carrier protein n=1 Tax=Streptomyces radicis TaxID=1750517 RepID=A0A3A9VVQ0_9ACTN|nr:acyl carrier protein [Streptomyces radicis]RKN05085.1 acyl carrier protein [Streptomyces radicis]RKN16411.1 acyl carrier protein [Streptomyces radicis]
MTTHATATTAETITGFITGRFPRAEIDPAKDIFSLGYINSLFAMELVMFIEKTFELTIPNEELSIDNFRTVEAMTALVDRLRPAVTTG